MSEHAAALDAALAHPTVRVLAAALATHPGAVATVAAEDPTPRRAAVAAVLRLAPGDATPWDTAARETWEETGLDLRRDARLLGTLDELYPRTPTLPPIVVRPYVVVTGSAGPLRLSAELADGFWAPLGDLRRPDVDRTSTVTARGRALVVPSFVHGGYTIWGMTDRIVRQLLRLLD